VENDDILRGTVMTTGTAYTNPVLPCNNM